MELREVMMGTAAVPKAPSQNLIKPDKIAAFGDAPGFWKAIVLDILSIGAALFFGYAYFRYLFLGTSPWILFVAFLVSSVASVMQVFLAPTIGRRALVILGESIALTVFFSTYDSWQILCVISTVAFVMLFWGYLAARADARNNMEMRFFRTTRAVLGKLVTAALFVLILVYIPQVQGPGVFIPKESFRILFDWTAGSMNTIYPGLSMSGTFGDASQKFVKAEMASNPTFQNLSVTAQNAATQDAVAQLSGTIEKTTGVAPVLSEPVSDVMYRVIVSTLNGWQKSMGNWFIVAWVAVLFFTLRTIGVVFMWIAQFISLVFYEILLATGFMHIEQVTQTKEVVQY